MPVKQIAQQYIPFARKYRPSNFQELYGQEVLTKILSYTIVNDRISHGYLLTGIRGVGKTTSARIIAKTINCTNLIVENDQIKPCEDCQNCISFNKNNHPDIIEIDAASKTSVEDIRKIIESSDYKPLVGRYTIFIIDEVHMLSKGAFNALLKILEEPPHHLIFIFATTEPQKIPLTVISRCQRYDLRRLTFDEIFQLIQEIVIKEQLQFEIEALKIIASSSDGSARDAISILDQSTNLVHDGLITSQMINKILGIVDTVSVVKFVQYIIEKDAIKSIDLLNNLYISSANLEIFVSLVADLIAHLSKIKLLPHYHNPIYEAFNDVIIDILTKITFSGLSIIWQIYSKGVLEVKNSHNQLIEVEMLAIKSIYSQMLPSAEELASANNYDDEIKLESVKLTSPPPIKNYQITDFLNYLHLHREMEIYYILLNQVELTDFNDQVIKIAGNDINKKIQEQISNLLFAWTGKAWSINFLKQEKIITLKEQLIDKVKSSMDWEILKKHFPEIVISDILLKN